MFCWYKIGVINFCSVWFLSKKNNQIKNCFFKKNRNRTKTGSNQPVSVRFGFLGQKPIWLGFFGLTRFFFGLAWFFPGFFLFGFGSVFSVSGL
jgi:hypothetical protein